MNRFFLLFLILFVGFSSCKKDSKRKVTKHHRQSVGSWSEELLSDRKYEELTIQMIYMTGCKPTDEAVANLVSLLEERCKKPDGINVVYKEIAAQGKTSYTISDVKEIEDSERSEFTAKKVIAVTFLFLDGPSSDDSADGMVLGQAYYNTSLVIYEATIQDNSDEFVEPARYKLETLVMNHEAGHILGLVNLGAPMISTHQDTNNGAHCSNPDCLMYWEAETGSAIINLVGNNPIPTLDANCIADLKGNGGK
jgi:hypothetical protein